eukprot:scaffold11103_cov117-Cylindrotheca_fusiformis.AAC.6
MALMYFGLLAYTQVFCGALWTLSADIAVSNNTSLEIQSCHLTVGIPQLIFRAVFNEFDRTPEDPVPHGSDTIRSYVYHGIWLPIGLTGAQLWQQ